MFDNRQLGTLIILGSAFILSLLLRSSRKSVKGLARQLITPAILVPFLLYFLWLGALHVLASLISLWNASLLGESLFWVIITGIVYLFSAATDAARHENFFRRRALEIFKIAVFFEFFVNIKSFSLPLEIVTQVTVAILAVIRVIAVHKNRPSQARRAGLLMIMITFGLFANTTAFLVRNWDRVDKGQESRKLLMPIWLTIGAMPFLFALALVFTYGQAFGLMKAATGLTKTPWRARIGIIMGLRLRLIDIKRFDAQHHRQAVSENSVRGGIQAVHDFRAKRDLREFREVSATQRLEALAGFKGTDECGRRLDQREFKETRDALFWLSTCQMGWHNNRGQYRSDLLSILSDGFSKRGLTEDHGVIMQVADDGSSWFAYRRTVTGWVLGIGAIHEPSDQWFYDSAEAPTSYPSPGGGWGDGAHFRTVNW